MHRSHTRPFSIVSFVFRLFTLVVDGMINVQTEGHVRVTLACRSEKVKTSSEYIGYQ